MTFLFVLPAYNEEAVLGSLLKRIKTAMNANEQPYHIFVVNDGSTDETARIATQFSREIPLTLISHRANQGLGAALQTGFLAACKEAQNDDAVITMDADDTHDPQATLRLWPYIQKDFDVMIASRYGTGGGEVGVSWPRRLCSRVVCALLRTLFPIPGVRDYSSGYRMYRGEILNIGIKIWGDDFVSEKDFTCMAEVLLKLRRIKAHIGELAVPLRYDRKRGASKLRVFRTIIRYFVLMARELFLGIVSVLFPNSYGRQALLAKQNGIVASRPRL